ncbi:MAG TPA: DUF1684 domain-containing protein [Bryobacteraceae bacterium]
MRRWLVGTFFLAMAATTYEDSIRAWQQHRDAGLRAPDGWLTLVGLFWLKPGANTIGSAPSNDFVLPKNAPPHAGTFYLQGDKITFGQKTLSYDDLHPDIIQIGSISLLAIRRAGRFAIRARDTASPVRKNFRGMRYFPTNPAFHFRAKLIPNVKKIPILNIVGQTEMEESPGWVEFTFNGHPYRLRPIYEETSQGRTLYFLFKDTTNKSQTYQAGRMLNTPLAVNGIVDLDFNRSYTPPCAFTPYATCPLPPQENRLPIAIEAGELRYEEPHS